jgi:MurNAc alpha-1-phosphate uridylyltransferase
MPSSSRSARIETAMVMAAGVGKRMRPLTATTPKPLIEVADRALIDHGLDKLVAAGVKRAVVNVHYIADLVEHHVRKRRDVEIIVSDERAKLLETGGGLVKARPLLGDQPFFQLNSDSFWIEGIGKNLNLMTEQWDEERMDILLLVASTVRSVGYEGRGDFTMDVEGRLIRRVENRVAPFVYAGAAIIHPRVLEGLKEESFSVNRCFDAAAAKGRLHGVRLDGIWLHVGTPTAIAEAEAAIKHSAA